MATLYYANQYNGPFERPHNQEWELDKAANGTFVRGAWAGVPYDPPTRVKRDCEPFVREDLKVKNACDVTDFVVENDRGHLKKGFKDPCGIPFYGNYRGTWDLPPSILGRRERHLMGRRIPNPRFRCTAEEIHVGRRNCYEQWDNAVKARIDAQDLRSPKIYPEDMNQQDIRNWERCAGRKMPWRVGKHTDAITLTPQPRLMRMQRWEPNRDRCKKNTGRRNAFDANCSPDELFLLVAPMPALKATVKMQVRDYERKGGLEEECLKRCLGRGKLGRGKMSIWDNVATSGRSDDKGKCDDGDGIKSRW